MDIVSLYNESPYFFICGSISLLLFLLNTILLFVGGDYDGALDTGLDVDTISSEAAFQIFSLQSILAFFLGHGWLGLALKAEVNLPTLFAFPISFVFGVCLMLFSAYLMAKVKSLNHVKKLNYYSALGEQGTVYTTIPRDGLGKVEVVVAGQLKVMDARTQSSDIASHQKVRIVDIDAKNILTVETIKELEHKREDSND